MSAHAKFLAMVSYWPGKTLLARATAGEANVPFYTISGECRSRATGGTRGFKHKDTVIIYRFISRGVSACVNRHGEDAESDVRDHIMRRGLLGSSRRSVSFK